MSGSRLVGLCLAVAVAVTVAPRSEPAAPVAVDHGLRAADGATTTVWVPRTPRRPLPSQFQLSAASTRFDVTFVEDGSSSWPPAARAAFQEAVDIWADAISSDVPIRVTARFETFSESRVLGSAGYTQSFRLDSGTPNPGTYHPVALAEAVTGQELNGGQADIAAQFNAGFEDWYFGVDGKVAQNQWDFVTVVLHELAHGLGFGSSASHDGTVGSLRHPPSAYDSHLVDGLGGKLVEYTDDSVQLGTALTGGVNGLDFSGPRATANHGAPPPLYAPSSFEPGSSVSHLDSDTFLETQNALMRPRLYNGTAIHTPGPVTLCLFQDLGWSTSQDCAAPASSVPAITEVTAGDGQVRVAWREPDDIVGAGGYRVRAYVDGMLVTSADATSSPVTVTGLTAGERYRFTVAGVASDTESAESAPVTPTGVTVPGVVHGVTADARGGRVAVRWAAPTSDGNAPLEGYRLTLRPTDEALAESVEVTTSATSATLEEVEVDVAYVASVAAVNRVGEGFAMSAEPVVVAATPAAVPSAPTDVKASADVEAVEVSWSPPDDDGRSPITGYVVTVDQGDGDEVTTETDGESVRVRGLVATRPAVVTVAARNAVGLGASAAAVEPVTPLARADATPPSAPALPGTDGDAATTERIAQSEAVGAALAISQQRFAASDGAAHAVLSRGDDFPDSLAGAALTGEGPLLLTATSELPPATLAELERVLPEGGTVYLLGGPGAISPDIEALLAARGFAVRRLAGASRMETAVAVASEVRRLHPEVSEVLLARAYPGESASSGWADSVTGGAYAAAAGVPILVTPTDEVHPATAAWLTADAPSRSVLLGGSAALSDAVAGAVPAPVRVSGAERAATAVAIAAQLHGVGATGARSFTLVNGYRDDGWAFGLAAAGIAADGGAPLLVVGDDLPDATAAAARGCSLAEVEVLAVGDTSVISDQVIAQLDGVDGAACPDAR